MASQQKHKIAVVAVFLAALVLASPAAAYRPEASGYTPATPAEATPTEAAVSTPTEASTPAEAGTPVADGYKPGAAAEATPTDATPTETADSTPTEASTPTADGYKPGAAASTPADATPTDSSPTEASTPAEATPTEAAASTPVAPGYTPAAADGTTPAAESSKATTDVQKLMEMVNGAYKKALDAANAAAPDDKFSVFDGAFDKEIKAGLAGRIEFERAMFTTMINGAIKDAYVTTSAITAKSEEERFSVFVFTLTEALRVMAATVEAHAVKPATEEAVAGGVKEPAGDQQVIGKIDAAVKVAASAAKEAPLSDKFLVYEASFNKAFKDEMGPDFDENKTVPQLNSAYREAYKATVAATPEKRFDAFLNGLTKYIMVISKTAKAAARAAAGTKTAAKATTEPAAEATYKPAPEATTEPAADAAAKPAAEATYKPTAEATTEPAAEATTEPAAEATYKPAAEATTEPAAEVAAKPAAEATYKPVADATTEPAAEATTEPAAETTYKPAAEATAKPAGGYNL